MPQPDHHARNNRRPSPITVRPSAAERRRPMAGLAGAQNADSFQVHADGDAVELLIYGVIGLPKEFGGVEASDVAEALAEHANASEVRVRLNSPGGFIFDGVAIYNQLVRHRARVVMDIDGIAASIASVIAMAGDEIRIAANAMMMIHDPSNIVWGTAEEMRRQADLLDKRKAQLVKTYVARTGIDADEVTRLMSDETWLDADEAIGLGFADTIVEDEAIAAPSNFNFAALQGLYQVPDRAAAFFQPTPQPENRTMKTKNDPAPQPSNRDDPKPEPAPQPDPKPANDAQPKPNPEPKPEDQTAEPAPQPEDRETEGKRFIDAFGEDDGPKYFAEGLSFEQAQARAVKDLRERNEQLNQRLAASDKGGEPVDFQDDEAKPKPKGREALASLIKVRKKD